MGWTLIQQDTYFGSSAEVHNQMTSTLELLGSSIEMQPMECGCASALDPIIFVTNHFLHRRLKLSLMGTVLSTYNAWSMLMLLAASTIYMCEYRPTSYIPYITVDAPEKFPSCNEQYYFLFSHPTDVQH